MRRLLVIVALALVVLVAMMLFGPSGSVVPAVAPSAGVKGKATHVAQAVRPVGDDAPAANETAPLVRLEAADRLHSAGPARTAEAPAPEPVLAIQIIDGDSQAPFRGVRLWARLVGETSRTGEMREGSHGRMGDSVVTDEQGRASFVVSADRELSVYGYSGDFSVAERVPALRAGETREVLIEVGVERLRVSGQVRSAVDDLPIGGALIHSQGRVAGEGLTWAVVEHNVVTDPNGVFEIEVAHLVRPMEVSADGFVSRSFDSNGDDARGLKRTVYLEPTAALVVTVHEADGAPARGVSVTTSDARVGRYFRRHLPRHAVTHHNGVARIDPIDGGVPLNIKLRRGGEVVAREAERVGVEPGAVAHIEITLGGGVPLTGRVIDQAGEPQAGFRVALSPAVSGDPRLAPGRGRATVVRQTDAGGHFEFESVRPGIWWLSSASTGGGVFRPRGDVDYPAVLRVVEIVEDSTGEQVELVLERGLYIVGTVELPEGGPPVGSVSVSAVGSALGSAGGFAARAEQGRFRIGPVAAAGTYEVRAIPAEIPGVAASLPVRAMAGEDELVLYMRAGATIEAVVGSEREEWPSGTYRLFALEAGTATESQAGEVRTGKLQIEGVLPGLYRLTITTAAEVLVVPSIEVSEKERVVLGRLHLAAGARLRVRSTSLEPLNVTVRSNRADVQRLVLTRGEPVTLTVPPGTVVLEAKRPSGEESRTEVFTMADELREVALP